MNVDGIRAANPTRPVASAVQPNAAGPATSLKPGSDVVDISDAARLAAKVQQTPEIRTDLVNSIKAEIAAGTYETPERIERAVDGLMEEFFGPGAE